MKNFIIIFQIALMACAFVCLINGNFEFGMLDCILAELLNIELKLETK